MSGNIIKRRVYLTYPADLVREPLVCQMYDKYQVQFNLRTASITDEVGIIGLELSGPADKVTAAIAFFRDSGVRVEPIELDVVAG